MVVYICGGVCLDFGSCSHACDVILHHLKTFVSFFVFFFMNSMFHVGEPTLKKLCMDTFISCVDDILVEILFK